jgi:hypothetical protein
VGDTDPPPRSDGLPPSPGTERPFWPPTPIWRRWWVWVIVGVVVLGALGASGALTTGDEECIDGTAVERARTRALDALSAASLDVGAGDLTAAAADMREVADSYRALADVMAAETEASGKLRKAASSWDGAAQSAEDGDIHLFIAQEPELVAAMSEAQDAFSASTLPVC